MAKLLEKCCVLSEMLKSAHTETQTGERIRMHSNVALGFAEALYETVLRTRPKVTVEIGMAFGVSSLAILSALREINQQGKLISIDPVQSSYWKGCGRAAIARAGLGDLHEMIEDYDYHALPRLLSSGLKVDFAYIDGTHTFDYVLLDWWYLDKMLAVDGVVGFNDCFMDAIDKVIRFLLSHRKYAEIDVGLPITFSTRGRKQEFFRRLMFGRKTQWYARGEDRYFKKTENWEPEWDYFAPF